MFADVVGYSSLMEMDELDTHVKTAAAIGIFSKLSSRYGGVVQQMQGDGLLISFELPEKTLAFAICALREVDRADYRVAGAERIQFRVGIHFGQIIQLSDGVRGHAVNVTARIQDITPPDRIGLSGSFVSALSEHVARRYPIIDAGWKNLKNIDEPVRLFILGEGESDATHDVQSYTLSDSKERDFDLLPSIVVCPTLPQGSSRQQARLLLDITDELHFQIGIRREFSLRSHAIFSNDRSHGRLILRLCRFYGIDYLLEWKSAPHASTHGSLVAQLIRCNDARVVTTLHWQESSRSDLERLKSKTVTNVLKIVSAVTRLELSVSKHEPHAEHRHLRYLLSQRSSKTLQEEENRQAIATLSNILDKDASHSSAWVALAHAQHMAWRYDWGANAGAQLEGAIDSAKHAIDADPENYAAHSELGFAYIFADNIAGSIRSLKRAYEINPLDPGVLANYADMLMHCGDKQGALRFINHSLALNDTIDADWRIWTSADVKFSLGDYQGVVDAVESMTDRTQGSRLAAASFGLLGDSRLAAAYKRRVLTNQPDFSVSAWAAKHPSTGADNFVAPFVEGMTKIGMPA